MYNVTVAFVTRVTVAAQNRWETDFTRRFLKIFIGLQYCLSLVSTYIIVPDNIIQSLAWFGVERAFEANLTLLIPHG